ncbi:MAG: DUF3306 domain-containing protein, partial [Pseudomonadota bacterium]
MTDQADNFLSRWSRRKRLGSNNHSGSAHPASNANQPSVGAPSTEPPTHAPAPEMQVAAHDQSSAEILEKGAGYPSNGAPPPPLVSETAKLDGPEGTDTDGDTPEMLDAESIDFEALDFDSDYERFMDSGVNDETRNKALRKLWVSNPILANMDGLDDYCEDYTDAAVCLPKGMMKTAYQFGRGFLNDEEVAEWEALGKPDPEVDPKDNAEDDEKIVENAPTSGATETTDGTAEDAPETIVVQDGETSGVATAAASEKHLDADP